MKNTNSRRNFLKKAAIGGIALGGRQKLLRPNTRMGSETVPRQTLELMVLAVF